MTKRFSRFLFSLFVVVLTSCGGGGGGGNGAAPGGNGGGPSAPTGEPAGTIEGIAQDGPLNNATVTAYVWNGTKGAVLGAAQTDFQGRYRLTVQAASQPVLLEVTGGFYVDEATFKQVSLTTGQALLGVIGYQSGRRQSAMVTYYTTLAAGLAERLVRNGASASDAVTAANQRISGLLALDVTNVEPADTTRSDLITVSPSVAYGFATAAVSSFTDFVSTGPSVPRTSSIQFIQLAYDDIREDGVLDGRGTDGDLLVGTTLLTAEIYRHQLALHLLRLADNPSTNFSRIRVADLVATARSLNDSTDGVFGNTPVVALASDAPDIAAVSVSDNAVIFGTTSISVTVGSVAGVNRVDAQILDSSQNIVAGPVVAADPKNPTITINTTTIPDGTYQLTLRATDTAGAVGTRTVHVTIANNQAVIENISLPIDRPVRGVQTVTATINDPVGVARVDYFINAILDRTFPNQDSQDPRTPYVLDTTRLPAGRQTLRITLTNQQGSTFSRDLTFVVDNTAPSITDVTPASGAFVRQVRGGNGEELFDEQNRRIGFMITGTAVDANGIGSVEALVNNVSIGTRPSLPFPVPLQSDGTKNIVLRVRDVAGNVAEAARQITFDATRPTSMIESPLGPNVTGQIRILGSGSDNIALSSLRLGIVETARNLEIGCFGGETGDSGAGGRYILTFDTSAFTNGTYQLTLYARDQAGNESTSQPVVLTFNNTPARTAPNQGNTTPKCFLAP